MKLQTIFIIAMIAIFMSSGLAETKDQMDACNGLAIFYVWNDTAETAPDDSLAPQGTTDLSNCPTDVFNPPNPPDTVEQLFYPDTLIWPDSVLSALAEFGSWDTSVSSGATWYPVTSELVEIPPHHDPACCKEGIYAKARMFDATTGTYSPWADINTTDMMLVNYVAGYGLFLQIAMDNFKTRDFSAAMGFNCNTDTLILYVWDCDDSDVTGTAGEFGVVQKIFPDGASLGSNRVYLHRYGVPVGVDDKPTQTPKAYSLAQNQPNPFNSATQISYALPEDANVKIDITNILGQKVRTLVNGRETAGYKSVVWNGLDDSGKEAPSGVYFYTIRANDFTAKKRAILMK